MVVRLVVVVEFVEVVQAVNPAVFPMELVLGLEAE
jgi:hypothetical protein